MHKLPPANSDSFGLGMQPLPRHSLAIPHECRPLLEPQKRILPRCKSFGCSRETWVIEDAEGTLGKFGFIVNVVADILPPGFLPLAFALRSTGLIPFVFLLLAVYCGSVFTMWATGKTLQLTGQRTWRRQWEQLIGRRTSWIPVLTLIVACFFNTMLMSCFSADVFARIVPISRQSCLLLFTIFPLAPLVCIKDLSGLTFTSFLALVALMYTVVFMFIRACDGSYAIGGRFFESVPNYGIQPGLWSISRGTLGYLGYCVFSFLIHYNGCKFYRELENATTTNFLNCTIVSFGICVFMFGMTGILGFMTFGMHTKIAILTNYNPSDTMAKISSATVAASLVLSYPLMFVGLKEAMMELFVMVKPELEEVLEELQWNRLFSLALLFVLTVGSLCATDIEPVVTLTGCTCGVACVFIIPCVLCSSALSECLNPPVRLIFFLRCFACFWILVGGCVTANAIYDIEWPDPYLEAAMRRIPRPDEPWASLLKGSIEVRK